MKIVLFLAVAFIFVQVTLADYYHIPNGFCFSYKDREGSVNQFASEQATLKWCQFDQHSFCYIFYTADGQRYVNDCLPKINNETGPVMACADADENGIEFKNVTWQGSGYGPLFCCRAEFCNRKWSSDFLIKKLKETGVYKEDAGDEEE